MPETKLACFYNKSIISSVKKQVQVSFFRTVENDVLKMGFRSSILYGQGGCDPPTEMSPLSPDERGRREVVRPRARLLRGGQGHQHLPRHSHSSGMSSRPP